MSGHHSHAAANSQDSARGGGVNGGGIFDSRLRRPLRVSPLRVHPALVTAYAEVKQAAAEANMLTGDLDEGRGRAVARAAAELAAGRWREQFDLDVFQAGPAPPTT